MRIGVAIGTFGDLETWGPLALRAVESVDNQTIPVPVAWVHGDSLAAARNDAVLSLDVDWVIVCDADDELDVAYVESMMAATGDIRRPSTYGIYSDGTEEDSPSMIPTRDIRYGNYIVIGAMFRKDLFTIVGGFDPAFEVLEDWDLWRSMIERGAVVQEVPDAIYRIHVVDGSRNMDLAKHGAAYQAICAKHAR